MVLGVGNWLQIKKALRPLKDNSSRRSKRKVRYGLALALEKNNQQTKNLFGTF